MNRLQELAGINEIKVNAPSNKRVVYALCDEGGSFSELIILNKHNIIEDVEEENDDGVYSVYYKYEGGEIEDYYLQKIEI